ncbi:MAG: hypothetical protein ACRDQ1_16020, partial [Sciscionella sp.]
PAVPGSGSAAPGVPGGVPRMWTQRGGRVLALMAQQGGCSTTRLVLQSQDSSKVVVVEIKDIPATGGYACPLYVREVPLAVLLDAPLGTRSVTVLHRSDRTS